MDHKKNHHHDARFHKAPRDLPPDQQNLDPAHQALAEAFRISFVVLKLVMIVVVIMFFIGGIYDVEQNEQAIVLRFGKVLGTGSDRIKQPGLHWAFPAPIDEVIKIPGPDTIRQLDVYDFWYYQDKEQRLGLKPDRPGRTLQFTRDGYSLTASESVAGLSLAGLTDLAAAADLELEPLDTAPTDYNIVHTQWQIFYTVNDPILFAEQLWDGTEKGWNRVEHFLRVLLADAVITTSANWDIDRIIWNAPQMFKEQVERHMTRQLRQLNVGLQASLVFVDKIPPRQVKPAFDRAAGAGIEAERIRTQARTLADELHGQARADAEMILASARAYKTRVVQAAKADNEYLNELLEKVDLAARQQAPDDPQRRQQIADQLIATNVDLLYQETLREIISDADEIFVPPANPQTSNEWRIYLSRDPTLEPQKEEEQPDVESIRLPPSQPMPM